MPENSRRGVLRHTTRAAVGTSYAALWLVLAVVAFLTVFLASSRTVNLASHDAILRPTLSGKAVVHTGPVLPDLRMDSGSRIGVDIQLGKTDAESTDALVQRYAYIAGQPEGQKAKVHEAIAGMAYDAAVRGAILGLVPILVWVLIGSSRRRQLIRRVPSRQGACAAALVLLIGIGLWEPWASSEDTVEAHRDWMPLATFLGPEVHLPDEFADVEVRGDVTTTQTQRLIASAIDTYDKSKTFYADAATRAADLSLHQPADGDTVVALVADRHDNIGMDVVARAIADTGGASAVFDAGDDTSAGKTWEAFSLDSLDAAFDDLDRWGVAGNHDHGGFVRAYLSLHGWRMLDGAVVDGPGGATLMGVDDPRSSGLGSWRDESGLSFDEVGSRLADAACASEVRISTLLVHDADLGSETLARGCADLVLAGHLHVQVGPTRVVGENGEVGYSFTTGTTGGAAYAIALGSKPRRTAQVTLVTYRDGRPTGLQPVRLETDGRFVVGDYRPLHLT
ncbi:metallophosphoesterase [Nocardioides sp.]|uniref:metallophosphoesterase family protein n=1 Tax=Nocardioides sp. TaxID=35761 RepID=UPI0031FEEACA|nr:metallophosphoesterase [Nocardioides sp.]